MAADDNTPPAPAPTDSSGVPQRRRMSPGTTAFRATLQGLPRLRRAGVDLVAGEEQTIQAQGLDENQIDSLLNDPNIKVEEIGGGGAPERELAAGQPRRDMKGSPDKIENQTPSDKNPTAKVR